MVTASPDTTTTNAGQSFKVAYTTGLAADGSANNINTAYGSLGAFPYMTSANQDGITTTAGTPTADLYMKVWQDSTCYTAIKNGWSVASGSSKTTLNTFATSMNSATDPWSDYRFAILNKLDLSEHATAHAAKFDVIAVAAQAAGYFHDYWVGYCVRQDTFGGVCAEVSIAQTWSNYNEFTAPSAVPTFKFAAIRAKKAAKILSTSTATDTANTPVGLVTADAAIVPAGTLSKATEMYGFDSFAGSADTFAAGHIKQETSNTISVDNVTWACATSGVAAAACGDGTTAWKGLLATTNLDYTMSSQSGFNVIGAGASYKAGAMWTYLWGWVATTTTANQTSSNDLTFESGMKYTAWSVKEDLFQALAAGTCATGAGNCNRATPAAQAVSRAATDFTDITPTRMAMGSTSLVASAAAAIVAASLAF